jgi:hypothetical protein
MAHLHPLTQLFAFINWLVLARPHRDHHHSHDRQASNQENGPSPFHIPSLP